MNYIIDPSTVRTNVPTEPMTFRVYPDLKNHIEKLAEVSGHKGYGAFINELLSDIFYGKIFISKTAFPSGDPSKELAITEELKKARLANQELTRQLQDLTDQNKVLNNQINQSLNKLNGYPVSVNDTHTSYGTETSETRTETETETSTETARNAELIQETAVFVPQETNSETKSETAPETNSETEAKQEPKQEGFGYEFTTRPNSDLTADEYKEIIAQLEQELTAISDSSLSKLELTREQALNLQHELQNRLKHMNLLKISCADLTEKVHVLADKLKIKNDAIVAAIHFLCENLEATYQIKFNPIEVLSIVTHYEHEFETRSNQ